MGVLSKEAVSYVEHVILNYEEFNLLSIKEKIDVLETIIEGMEDDIEEIERDKDWLIYYLSDIKEE